MVEYEPGVCNIGPKGRFQRATFGIVAVVFCLGAWALIRLNTLPDWLVLLLFLPLFAAFVSIFEALFGFCVVYAARGTYDLR